MLTKIRLKNFRTFKEGTVIDFAATKYSKLKDSNVKDGVVKSCMFVGGNATGKSNVIAAVSALLYLLFDDSGTNMPVNFCSFSDEKYMEMEYIFRFGHDKVAYSLSFDREGRVRSEKVVLNGQTLLDRIDRGARTSLGNGNFYGSGEVEERSLILKRFYAETKFERFPALAKMFGYLQSTVYFNAFSNLVVSARDAVTLSEYVHLNGVDGINAFFEGAGLNIRLVYRDNGNGGRILVHHSGTDLLVPFALESLGNKVLLNMLPGYLEVISNGGMLVVDDFGANFHTALSAALVEYFMKNSANSQLIFATHSTHLMKTSLVRPDQIYTFDFDGGGSRVTRVSDGQPRELQNLEKMYYGGAFNGLPQFGGRQ